MEHENTLEQTGGCDHSVGVCSCSLIRLSEAITSMLHRNGINYIFEHPWSKGSPWTDETIREAYGQIAMADWTIYGHFLHGFAITIFNSNQDQFQYLKSAAVHYLHEFKIPMPKNLPKSKTP
jgi:hypothetical protein